MFIDVYTETGLYQRSRTGINYPYIFPDNKEIEDKIPTVTGFAPFNGLDGGPYPASSAGPIHTISDVTTMVRGRHTFKAGVSVEYSGEDDFDQINVSAIPGSTNNQNGRFEFLDGRAGGTGLAMANAALGLFSNYAELGQRNFTKWRALATDLFIQDSWKPNANLTVEGGVPLRLLAAVVLDHQQHRQLRSAVLRPGNAAVIDPDDGPAGRAAPATTASCCPGDGFEGEGNDLDVAQNPAVQALFRGEPRGFSQTHANVFEPRLGLSYSLEREDGVPRQRRHLPQPRHAERLDAARRQPAVPAAGDGVERQRGQPRRRRRQRRGDAALRHQRRRTRCSSTRRRTCGRPACSASCRSGSSATSPTSDAVACTCSGSATSTSCRLGTIQAQPGVNIAALRQYKGYNVIRLSENAGRSTYHSLQFSADRRYSNGLKVGVAYTLGESTDNGSNKRDVLYNTYDDTIYEGHSQFDRRHTVVIHYIYDLPFWRDQRHR